MRLLNAESFSQLPLDFIKFLLLLLGAMNSTMTFPFAADAFAGERERNTLELLQLAPVSPKTIFFAKLMTILPFAVFGAVLAQIVFLFMCKAIPGMIIFMAFLGAISFALLFNGLTLLLSLRSKTVRAATQTAALISLPFYFLIQAFYKPFFSCLEIPLAILIFSILFLLVSAHFSLKKFLES
jgi:ABC-type Na+ efflux pump permease subunit